MNTEQLLEWSHQEIKRLRRDNGLLNERVRTLDLVERLVFGQQGGLAQQDFTEDLLKSAQEIRYSKEKQNNEKQEFKDKVNREVREAIVKQGNPTEL